MLTKLVAKGALCAYTYMHVYMYITASLRFGAEYVCIFDESSLATQCRRDLVDVRAMMEQADLNPTEALYDALQLMLAEFLLIFY